MQARTHTHTHTQRIRKREQGKRAWSNQQPNPETTTKAEHKVKETNRDL